LKAVGIDGSAKRWAIVALESGRFVAATVSAALTPSPPICDGATAIGIDIPLTTPTEGRRSAESLARGRLPGRSSSVFSTPPVDILDEATYQEALDRARRVYGYGISAQAYALRRAIFDARASQLALHEVHPELSFSEMNSGHRLASKKSWSGMRQRLDLLADQGITIPASVGTAGDVPTDDLLDACAAAWSADRIGRGSAEKIGDEAGGYIWI
jgi:predicted RNase H-like nuclease